MTTNITTSAPGALHTIDATGKRMGIVATEAASILLGKNKADFAKTSCLMFR